MNREQRRLLQKQDLYQCQVTTREGTALLVGPASNVSAMAEAVAEGINRRVSVGVERDWHDAVVVRIKPMVH